MVAWHPLRSGRRWRLGIWRSSRALVPDVAGAQVLLLYDQCLQAFETLVSFRELNPAKEIIIEPRKKLDGRLSCLWLGCSESPLESIGGQLVALQECILQLVIVICVLRRHHRVHVQCSALE